jgi:hypothetical protein
LFTAFFYDNQKRELEREEPEGEQAAARPVVNNGTKSQERTA